MEGQVRLRGRIMESVGVDTRARSLVKALSYRAVSLLLMTLVAWAITRRLDVAAAIGVGDALLKLGLFYAHERVWTRVRYGRVSPPDYEI